MPASYVFKKMIKDEMKKLSKPVRLQVFLNNNEDSKKYAYTMSILKAYEESSQGMLTIEEHSIINDPDIAHKYEVQRAPTILFIDEEGNEIIRYLSAPQGSEIQPFIQAILVFAGAPNYYETTIKKNLAKVSPSTIKVMVTNSCSYCPEMVNIASQFALASEGKIKAVIIDIMENPDLGEAYDALSVPLTIINDEKVISGMAGANEIFQALIHE
ncbi:MAG: thioredoxin family protein [Candidatus Thorarchaeota archaeon]